jgi:hypothetical protein
MAVQCRIRRRKTFWVSDVYIGTMRAIEKEIRHNKVSQNLLERLLPA